MWRTLCRTLTWKMPSSPTPDSWPAASMASTSEVRPGMKPAMPTTRKTTPNARAARRIQVAHSTPRSVGTVVLLREPAVPAPGTVALVMVHLHRSGDRPATVLPGGAGCCPAHRGQTDARRPAHDERFAHGPERKGVHRRRGDEEVMMDAASVEAAARRER